MEWKKHTFLIEWVAVEDSSIPNGRKIKNRISF